jgi:hypothetical protein
VDPFFVRLESTALSTWIRDAPTVWAFPAILTCHTIGMGIVAGINAAIALRILGVAPTVPVGEMKRFLPAMWFGFWLNAVSGVLLLIAYPTKALTNPLFYFKLTLIALAVWFVQLIGRRVFRFPIAPGAPMPGRAKAFAAGSIALWAGAITAGRLLAYTYTRLTAIP